MTFQALIIDADHDITYTRWQDSYPSVVLPWVADGYPQATQWCTDNNIALLDVLPSKAPPGWIYYFRSPEARDAFQAQWAA